MTYPRTMCAGEAVALMTAVVEEVGRDHAYQRRRVIDEHGNVYQCVLYVCGGESDCLFGRMLERFGVPCHRLASCLHMQIGWVLARLDIVVSPLLAHHLRQAQVRHDLSLPWGYVLDKFAGICMESAEAGARL